MWKAFPKLVLWKTLFFIFSIFSIVALTSLVSESANNILSWSDFYFLLKIASKVSLFFLCFTYFFGKYGWLIFWKSPILGKFLNESLCPNLNGVWAGVIQSNFPFKKDKKNKLLTKKVRLIIKADLLGIKIELESDDNYQISRVTHFDIYKDPKTEVFYLTYIYEGYVPIPSELDDRVYQGAATLEIIDSTGEAKLKGTYWTNRAWQRKQNTAGVITLSKVIK